MYYFRIYSGRDGNLLYTDELLSAETVEVVRLVAEDRVDLFCLDSRAVKKTPTDHIGDDNLRIGWSTVLATVPETGETLRLARVDEAEYRAWQGTAT